MLFSFKEFEQTKNLIIKQFQQRPALELVNEDHNTIYEYQKLLNQIKYQKGNSYMIRKASAGTSRMRKQFIKSATSRRFYKTGDSKMAETFGTDRFGKFGKQNSTFRMSIEDTRQNFYLTSLITTNQSKQAAKILDQSCHFTKLALNQQNPSIEISQLQNKQQKQLLDLHINILQLTNQQQYLHHQIFELEQSIRYYKSLNNGIESKISQKSKKHMIELNSALKKQSNLNAVSSRNRYFEEKFNSTEVFFIKSLKSIKISRNSEAKKCSQLLDDTTQKILTFKHLKQKIQQQRAHIYKLDEKNKYKSKRIEENQNMHQYCLILLKIQKLTNFIKLNSYGKLDQFKELRKSLDSDIGIMQNSSQFQKKKVAISPDVDVSSINYLETTKQILKAYLKLKSDEERLQSAYEYKINQMQNNRKLLSCRHVRKQVNQTARSNVTIEISSEKEKIVAKDSIIHSKTSYLLENQIKKQEKKIKNLDEMILGVEERAKFFVKKCIKYLQNILRKWLKFDQSAINFVVSMSNKFIGIISGPKEQVSQSISKDILANHFENWERYIFFIEEVFSNPITNKFLSSENLTGMLRRIIKTKTFSVKVPTEKIFVRCLQSFHTDKTNNLFKNFQLLLRIAVQLIQYCSKFQVFIVNSQDNASFSNQTPNQAQDSQLHSIIKSGSSEMMNSKMKKFGYRVVQEMTKMSQKMEQQREDLEKEEESCSDIIDEDENQEICREEKEEDPMAVVNLILAYQHQINKISKTKKKGMAN